MTILFIIILVKYWYIILPVLTSIALITYTIDVNR